MREFDIDYLFMLNSSEREVLHSIVNRISAMIAQVKLTPEQIREKLINEVPGDGELQSFDAYTVSKVTKALIQILSSETAIPFLVAKLYDYDNRYLAALMLGWFGEKAQSAISELLDIASGTSGAVEVAKQSIILIGNAEREIILALQESVSANDDGEFRELSDLAIRYKCTSQREFQSILEFAAQSKNPDLREAVADAISKLGTTDKQKFTPILDVLKNDVDGNVRLAAFEAT